ncbi:MAG: mycobactin polyketide synthase MbtD [Mycobacterium sp.]
MPSQRLPDGRIPVLLSAHVAELVEADAGAIADYLDRFPAATVNQVARQLRRTRRVRRYRAVLRAGDRRELVDGLRALASGSEHPLVARSALGSAPRQAFVFPGQGGQWPGMGVVAYQELPPYRTATDSCAAEFEAAGIASPLRYLTAGDDSHTFSELEIEGAQFVHAVALAHVWLSCGVLPDLTVGHSLGEVAAAYMAGSITLPDAVAVVAARASVVDRLPGRYAVAALGISEQATGPLIAATDGWLELSVVNAHSTVAVSGDRNAVLAIVDTVRRSGRFAREITVGFPVHTSVLEPLRAELLAQLPAGEFAEAPVQFIGGTTGDVVAPGTMFRDYWYTNLRHTVRFDHAVESAIRCGANSFIELSANPALLFAIDQNWETEPDGPAVLVGSGRRDEALLDALSANIVTAAVADPGYAWGDLDPTRDGDTNLHGFPNAPMRATPMWAHREPLEALPAVPGPTRELTITVERWEQAAPTTPVPGPPVPLAVVDLGADGALARPLRAAIDSHPAVRLSVLPDAEVVVAIAPVLDADAEGAANALTRLVEADTLGFVAALGPQCRTVCLLTVGAERIDQHDAPQSPGHAALAAMHRSIGFDYPELTFHNLDLPSWELTPEFGAAVIEASLIGSGDTVLRESANGYTLFERTLRDAPAAPQWRLDSGLLDDVVITGGAGAIGLHYARYFAEHGARRIVLLSRRAADANTLQAFAAEYGGVLVSAPCDITDPDRLRSVAAEYGADGASLIVHAAGSASFAAAAGLTRAALADTFAAKVGGLARMVELWPVRPDGRVLLCSSVSGVWGGRGHAAYSAANRLLDVMAAGLRAGGRHCISVRWGLWQSQGNHGIVDAAEVTNIERAGLRQMSPRQAIEASLRDWRVDPLVFSADAARLQVFLDSRKAEPSESCLPTRSPTMGVPIVDTVRQQLAAVLGIQRAVEVNLEESLFDLGVDSMLAVDLRKRLKRVIGRTVPLAVLLDEITGDELVSKLESAHESAHVRSGTAQKVDISRD